MDLKAVQQLLSHALPGCNTQAWNQNTALLGALPEFDSMSVVTLITLVEESMDIQVDDADVSATDFETVGTVMLWIERMEA